MYKTALKNSLQEKYYTYENALTILELESLSERREYLCLQFAKKCLTDPKMKNQFQLNKKSHPMMTRFPEMYEVDHANTKRLQDSPIINMQKLLNGA